MKYFSIVLIKIDQEEMHPFSSLNHLHTKNQHTYNRGNNMTFNEQGVSSDTNGQIHTPNNSSFMQQQFV